MCVVSVSERVCASISLIYKCIPFLRMFGDYHLRAIYISFNWARQLIGNHFFHFILFDRIYFDKTSTHAQRTAHLNTNCIIINSQSVHIFRDKQNNTCYTFTEICLYCGKYLRNAKKSQNIVCENFRGMAWRGVAWRVLSKTNGNRVLRR